MRSHRLLSFLLLMLLISLSPNFSSAAAASGPVWSTITVDSNFGGSLSLALKPGTQQPYISYLGGSKLKLATPVSSGGDCGPSNSWSCSLLSSHYAYLPNQTFGLFNSAAFHPNGILGISYDNVTTNQLQLMTVPPVISGSSVILHSTVDNGSGGIYTSSSFGYDFNSGNAHITYTTLPAGSTTHMNLYHAIYAGSNNGAADVCGDLGYWRCDLITTDVAYNDLLGYQSMAFLGDLPILAYHNQLDRLSMAFYLGGYTAYGNCGPVSNNLRAWRCSVIDLTQSPDHSSVAVYYLNNQLGIAYYWISNNKAYVEIATPAAPGDGNCGFGNMTQPYPYDWQCTTIEQVDTLPTGSAFSALRYGVDIGQRDGKFIVTYVDRLGQANQYLKAAYPATNGNCGPLDSGNRRTWQCDTVDTGSGTHHLGSYISMKVNSKNTSYIAYSDDTLNTVKLATLAKAFRTYLPVTRR
jgi:hypothetical protein